MKLYGVFHFFFVSFTFAQTFEYVNLPTSLNETSGLESFKQGFLTHNDSGNTSSIFYINSNGNILFQKNYPEIENFDWEDITKDTDFFYIADSGNNYDTRKNLRILKFDINTLNYVGAINFNYTAQKDFSSNPKSEFDAEALVNFQDNLVLFSKNRKYKNTQLYLVPKKVGEYDLVKFGELDSNLIVTGADYCQSSGLLVLTGTKDFSEYEIQIYERFDFTSLTYKNKKIIPIPFDSVQVEAVKIINSSTLMITSENEDNSKNPSLIKVDFN